VQRKEKGAERKAIRPSVCSQRTISEGAEGRKTAKMTKDLDREKKTEKGQKDSVAQKSSIR